MLNARYFTLLGALMLAGSLLAADMPQGPVQQPGIGQTLQTCRQNALNVQSSVNNSLNKLQQAQNENNVDKLKGALADAQNTLKQVQEHFNNCPPAFRGRMGQGAMRARQQRQWSSLPSSTLNTPQPTGTETRPQY